MMTDSTTVSHNLTTVIRGTPDMIKPPRAFIYVRASTDKQSMSVYDQKVKCVNWFNAQTESGELASNTCFMGIFEDPDTSAKINWFDRKMGYELFRRLEPGDLVIVAVYDRAIRGPSDNQLSNEKMRAIGARPIYLDQPNLDINDPSTELFLNVRASLGQWERQMISKRTLEAHAAKRERGEWCGGNMKMGWKVVGKNPHCRCIPDMYVRRLVPIIVHMRDVLKLPYESIVRMQNTSKPWFPRHRNGVPWSRQAVQTVYDRQKAGWPHPWGVS